MGRLSHQMVQQLHDAAVSAGLVERRGGLLAGINTAFTATLRIAQAPSEQMLCDIHALNEADRLTDGTIPLILWLRNAVTLAASRKESATFKRVLELCGETIESDRDQSPMLSQTSIGGTQPLCGDLQVSDVQIIPNRVHLTCTIDFSGME